MIRILLVDDHPVVRFGIRHILVDGLKDVSIGEASDAAQAAVSLLRSEWDVVVLDVSLPGMSGIDILKNIRRERPELPVLMLSMHPAAQFERRALAAGATGYISKDTAPTELVKAIEEIRRGRRYVGGKGEPTGGAAQAPNVLHDLLSDREYQVLRLIGSGKMVSEIASSLGLSVKTVSTYRMRLLEKMGMHSNAELMRYAIENRLVDS
ncbi:MAG TPA: response regulator transcription factor [Vicinamibacterales bacterium]|nr:response regulator transcription factor [Vicinamibacterales bacterium]